MNEASFQSGFALDGRCSLGECTNMKPDLSSCPTLSRGDLSPELLAPAGNWECARAAVCNGADAIYFGLEQFNARLRADNFTLKDLPGLMNYLHSHGVKGFVTMNTLVFTDEMPAALTYLSALNDAGVDGVIVQDMGLAHILTLWKREHPEVALELHASTQMTLSSPEGIRFAERFLDLKRAVLARELSLDDIERCAQESDVPLEVFVHGALCVSYSGQCLTSESLGQRSANRGECAQACRLPYSLVVDGRLRSMGEKRYLLSPQDLCALDDIPELVRMGVKSYKIEGRLKSPEYVAAVTSAYRKALDAASADMPVDSLVTESDRYAMQMVFSRGFSHGWLHGSDHPKLTHGRHGKKRGALVGTVQAVGNGWVDLTLEGHVPLAPGDGFVFDAGEDRNEEQGGRIWKVQRNRLFFHGKASRVDWNRVRPGHKIWKTDDPALNAGLRQSWSRERSEDTDTLPLDLDCSGREGAPLKLSCPAWGVFVQTDMPLATALNRPLTPETLREQLGRLGGTGYSLRSCTVDVPDGLMLPLSVLNKARRDLVEQLNLQEKPVRRVSEPFTLPPLVECTSVASPQLSVLCRQEWQIAPCLQHGIKTLYLDYEDMRRYGDSVKKIREMAPDVSIFLATPRIQKPKEEGYFKMLDRLEPDGILVRNWGAAEYFQSSPLRLIGDFSLNVSNPWAADVLLKYGCFERLTISYDLNAGQVLDLLEKTPGDKLELTLHQHMPMFHMEHCVFCTFLSDGGHNFKDCGRPCEQYRVHLKDRVGQLHPLFADTGCRNTLFSGRAQTGASFFPAFRDAGLSHYRIELLDDTARKTSELLQEYGNLLSGNASASSIATTLDLLEQLGTTAGTLA